MPINQSGLSATVRVSLGNNRLSTATTNNIITTLKGQSVSITQLSNLLDVVESAPQSGFIPVYDAEQDKYVIQRLSSNNINITSVDGGSF